MIFKLGFGTIYRALVDMIILHCSVFLTLYVVSVYPNVIYFILKHQWSIKRLCFEFDTEPYYQSLDDKVRVSVFGIIMHSLLVIMLLGK